MAKVRKKIDLGGTTRRARIECDEPEMPGPLPRVTRLMALAIRFDELLRTGKIQFDPNVLDRSKSPDQLSSPSSYLQSIEDCLKRWAFTCGKVFDADHFDLIYPNLESAFRLAFPDFALALVREAHMSIWAEAVCIIGKRFRQDRDEQLRVHHKKNDIRLHHRTFHREHMDRCWQWDRRTSRKWSTRISPTCSLRSV